MQNPYLELTAEFNQGRLRALLSSGQAVVVHRLAVMSKDGDWILREDDEATDHVLAVLERRGARYRFGAPLDCRWLSGGWSSHLEHRTDVLRIRTDFVTRPPRISSQVLSRMWHDAEQQHNPVVGLEPLAAIKLTNREKDYAVVGELARRMPDPRARMLYSRSSRDLIEMSKQHPELVDELTPRRSLLAQLTAGRDELEAALDRERRLLMQANELWLERYGIAAALWSKVWTALASETDGLPLREAHALIAARATGILPFSPDAGDEDS